MSTCLGLYIEDNIIKYAKVTKERDQLKVDAFGVKIYDNLDEAIKQVVDETYSYQVPIYTNLSQENYNFFYIFSLLNKNDIAKAVETEFESYCSEKNYNSNAFESRYALVPSMEDKEKLKAIHVSENKIQLGKKTQLLGTYDLKGIVPLSMAISGITQFGEKEKAIIVNIENKTEITTIMNQQIYDITTLDIGSQDILDKINMKENSYSKAYEICKETTIYTSEGKNLVGSDEDINYLEDIMPTLYQIVGQVRKIINESFEKIDKVYITGTAALINNIDLYFGEYLEKIDCEILKPNFIKISPEINIKDYIEVNSAIALALSGLGEGVNGMNFQKASFSEKLSKFLKLDLSSAKNLKEGKEKTNIKINKDVFKFDFNMPLDRMEKGLLNVAKAVFLLFIIYSTFAYNLNKQIDDKIKQADESIQNTNAQIRAVESDKSKITTRTNEYSDKISSLQQVNQEVANNNKVKKSIPILLNRLINITPTGVQITSIQNTTDKHIVIKAQSSDYDQLGYLVSSLRNQNVLTSVLSSTGQKSNNIVSIQIEGDLP